MTHIGNPAVGHALFPRVFEGEELRESGCEWPPKAFAEERLWSVGLASLTVLLLAFIPGSLFQALQNWTITGF